MGWGLKIGLGKDVLSCANKALLSAGNEAPKWEKPGGVEERRRTEKGQRRQLGLHPQQSFRATQCSGAAVIN